VAGLSQTPSTAWGELALLWIELGWWHSPSSGSIHQPGAHVVVVSLDRPPSPLVHYLARSIIVWPPHKRAIAQGVGCHPTAASPTVADGSS
jgi:hypothetical protein